ncbi:MAG: type VI secretion system baseplate subunit TssG [Bacteroidota bacterium]
MVNNNKITGIIQNIFSDIRAEAVIGDLIEKGLGKDEFIITNKGIFKRKYARDIDSSDIIKLKNSQQLVRFYLNRDGLYDSLPEGLFHGSSDKAISKSKNASDESKKIKKEEKAARDFFLPVENEIFLQRVLLELEERKILSRFSEELFGDIYPELWDLRKYLNKEYVYRLALLLHFAHKIAGDSRLTSKSLETILEEKVEASVLRNVDLEERKKIESNGETRKCMLGNGELGVDFVCGENLNNMDKTMVFNIGPLKNTKVEEYLEGGTIAKFLTCFYSYFVPVELDVKTNVLVEEKEQNFVLGGIQEGPVLGFESAI